MGLVCKKMAVHTSNGNKKTSNNGDGSDYVTHSNVDLAIIKALKLKSSWTYNNSTPSSTELADNDGADSLGKEKRINTFDKIVMKFPTLKATFKSIRNLFVSYDMNPDGTLRKAEVLKALERLGASNRFLMTEIFTEADLDTNESLDFREFLVCVAISHVLGSFKTNSESGNKTLTEIPSVNVDDVNPTIIDKNTLFITFETICGSYILFDANCDGGISKDEVFALMSGNEKSSSKPSPSASPKSATSNRLLNSNNNNTKKRIIDPVTESRWHELDFDDDGQISFREYIACFILWVGLDIHGNDELDMLNDDYDDLISSGKSKIRVKSTYHEDSGNPSSMLRSSNINDNNNGAGGGKSILKKSTFQVEDSGHYEIESISLNS